MIYKRSSALFKEAKQYIVGGVNSPVRAFSAVGGEPIFVKRAKGAYLYDEDNRKLIDYISSWGPMILGHAFEPVVKALVEATKKGTSYGIPTELETKIAKLAVEMVPHIDKIRFVNSGTEACMSAVRLARGYTGKDKIIKFAGCYHGHSDAFLIQAGSGAVTFGTPNSPGVTPGTVKDTLLAGYNNLDEVKSIIKANKDEIAAIILEPVAGNMGCIIPEESFIKGLRELCDEHDIVLIFDEVMTGFRLAKGGAQETLGIKADLVCFGKVIGGGLPVGAFAGPQHIMSHLAPEGPVYQAGTLSGNPLAMTAGYETLKYLIEHPEIYHSLEEKTKYLHTGIEKVLNKHGVEHQINRYGSMLSVHFTDEPVSDFESAAKGNNQKFKDYFHGMLKQSVYLPPSAFESYFLNDALTYEDLDYTIKALDEIAISL
ncbi:glutamate-1-semialdehyde 2,1-aminomutase [Mesohalobacter halotolerans]|uniref:Glutamate-1-semialdehyde 2,1-aminomutase n=1 Tax=Mesohalobacter halotolerans TaxID=1883405 RepID=A0A4U5TRB8_9FLAO|nr:glutamate-1-semialdehyde 2,1-aminomutase [Mesohalobacter halotolerans]TKS56331.1 glutamate-1-semialdehyde-2,1-aminomutase [Mesohalobacter halotolerans]